MQCRPKQVSIAMVSLLKRDMQIFSNAVWKLHSHVMMMP